MYVTKLHVIIDLWKVRRGAALFIKSAVLFQSVYAPTSTAVTAEPWQDELTNVVGPKEFWDGPTRQDRLGDLQRHIISNEYARDDNEKKRRQAANAVTAELKEYSDQGTPERVRDWRTDTDNDNLKYGYLRSSATEVSMAKSCLAGKFTLDKKKGAPVQVTIKDGMKDGDMSLCIGNSEEDNISIRCDNGEVLAADKAGEAIGAIQHSDGASSQLLLGGGPASVEPTVAAVEVSQTGSDISSGFIEIETIEKQSRTEGKVATNIGPEGDMGSAEDSAATDSAVEKVENDRQESDSTFEKDHPGLTSSHGLESKESLASNPTVVSTSSTVVGKGKKQQEQRGKAEKESAKRQAEHAKEDSTKTLLDVFLEETAMEKERQKELKQRKRLEKAEREQRGAEGGKGRHPDEDGHDDCLEENRDPEDEERHDLDDEETQMREESEAQLQESRHDELDELDSDRDQLDDEDGSFLQLQDGPYTCFPRYFKNPELRKRFSTLEAGRGEPEPYYVVGHGKQDTIPVYFRPNLIVPNVKVLHWGQKVWGRPVSTAKRAFRLGSKNHVKKEGAVPAGLAAIEEDRSPFPDHQVNVQQQWFEIFAPNYKSVGYVPAFIGTEELYPGFTPIISYSKNVESAKDATDEEPPAEERALKGLPPGPRSPPTSTSSTLLEVGSFIETSPAVKTSFATGSPVKTSPSTDSVAEMSSVVANTKTSSKGSLESVASFENQSVGSPAEKQNAEAKASSAGLGKESFLQLQMHPTEEATDELEEYKIKRKMIERLNNNDINLHDNDVVFDEDATGNVIVYASNKKVFDVGMRIATDHRREMSKGRIPGESSMTQFTEKAIRDRLDTTYNVMKDALPIENQKTAKPVYAEQSVQVVHLPQPPLSGTAVFPPVAENEVAHELHSNVLLRALPQEDLSPDGIRLQQNWNSVAQLMGVSLDEQAGSEAYVSTKMMLAYATDLEHRDPDPRRAATPEKQYKISVREVVTQFPYEKLGRSMIQTGAFTADRTNIRTKLSLEPTVDMVSVGVVHPIGEKVDGGSRVVLRNIIPHPIFKKAYDELKHFSSLIRDNGIDYSWAGEKFKRTSLIQQFNFLPHGELRVMPNDDIGCGRPLPVDSSQAGQALAAEGIGGERGPSTVGEGGASAPQTAQQIIEANSRGIVRVVGLERPRRIWMGTQMVHPVVDVYVPRSYLLPYAVPFLKSQSDKDDESRLFPYFNWYDSCELETEQQVKKKQAHGYIPNLEGSVKIEPRDVVSPAVQKLHALSETHELYGFRPLTKKEREQQPTEVGFAVRVLPEEAKKLKNIIVNDGKLGGWKFEMLSEPKTFIDKTGSVSCAEFIDKQGKASEKLDTFLQQTVNKGDDKNEKALVLLFYNEDPTVDDKDFENAKVVISTLQKEGITVFPSGSKDGTPPPDLLTAYSPGGTGLYEMAVLAVNKKTGMMDFKLHVDPHMFLPVDREQEKAVEILREYGGVVKQLQDGAVLQQYEIRLPLQYEIPEIRGKTKLLHENDKKRNEAAKVHPLGPNSLQLIETRSRPLGFEQLGAKESVGTQETAGAEAFEERQEIPPLIKRNFGTGVPLYSAPVLQASNLQYTNLQNTLEKGQVVWGVPDVGGEWISISLPQGGTRSVKATDVRSISDPSFKEKLRHDGPAWYALHRLPLLEGTDYRWGEFTHEVTDVLPQVGKELGSSLVHVMHEGERYRKQAEDAKARIQTIKHHLMANRDLYVQDMVDVVRSALNPFSCRTANSKLQKSFRTWVKETRAKGRNDKIPPYLKDKTTEVVEVPKCGYEDTKIAEVNDDDSFVQMIGSWQAECRHPCTFLPPILYRTKPQCAWEPHDAEVLQLDSIWQGLGSATIEMTATDKKDIYTHDRVMWDLTCLLEEQSKKIDDQHKRDEHSEKWASDYQDRLLQAYRNLREKAIMSIQEERRKKRPPGNLGSLLQKELLKDAKVANMNSDGENCFQEGQFLVTNTDMTWKTYFCEKKRTLTTATFEPLFRYTRYRLEHARAKQGVNSVSYADAHSTPPRFSDLGSDPATATLGLPESANMLDCPMRIPVEVIGDILDEETDVSALQTDFDILVHDKDHVTDARRKILQKFIHLNPNLASHIPRYDFLLYKAHSNFRSTAFLQDDTEDYEFNRAFGKPRVKKASNSLARKAGERQRIAQAKISSYEEAAGTTQDSPRSNMQLFSEAMGPINMESLPLQETDTFVLQGSIRDKDDEEKGKKYFQAGDLVIFPHLPADSECACTGQVVKIKSISYDLWGGKTYNIEKLGESNKGHSYDIHRVEPLLASAPEAFEETEGTGMGSGTGLAGLQP